MASRKKGLLSYLIPFRFGECVKIPKFAHFRPALSMSDAGIMMAISLDNKASHAISGTYCI